jgi:hypothetical protein
MLVQREDYILKLLIKLQAKLTKHLPEEDYLSEMCKSAAQIIGDHFEGVK